MLRWRTRRISGRLQMECSGYAGGTAGRQLRVIWDGKTAGYESQLIPCSLFAARAANRNAERDPGLDCASGPFLQPHLLAAVPQPALAIRDSPIGGHEPVHLAISCGSGGQRAHHLGLVYVASPRFTAARLILPAWQSGGHVVRPGCDFVLFVALLEIVCGNRRPSCSTLCRELTAVGRYPRQRNILLLLLSGSDDPGRGHSRF